MDGGYRFVGGGHRMQIGQAGWLALWRAIAEACGNCRSRACPKARSKP